MTLIKAVERTASLFRSAARDQISQSKCPYAKTISKIGEDFEIALIKAVARTARAVPRRVSRLAPAQCKFASPYKFHLTVNKVMSFNSRRPKTSSSVHTTLNI